MHMKVLYIYMYRLLKCNNLFEFVDFVPTHTRAYENIHNFFLQFDIHINKDIQSQSIVMGIYARNDVFLNTNISTFLDYVQKSNMEVVTYKGKLTWFFLENDKKINKILSIACSNQGVVIDDTIDRILSILSQFNHIFLCNEYKGTFNSASIVFECFVSPKIYLNGIKSSLSDLIMQMHIWECKCTFENVRILSECFVSAKEYLNGMKFCLSDLIVKRLIWMCKGFIGVFCECKGTFEDLRIWLEWFVSAKGHLSVL